MQRIGLGDVLLIAEIHAGVDAKRLARMDRVVTLTQSALAAPFAGFGDVELYPTLESKAAIYCSRRVSYHPLPDGNKRTAYDVMIEFVERNARTWTHAAGGLDETAMDQSGVAAALSPMHERDGLPVAR